ncbi:glycosyltransferase family 4 protein [uncultured Enterovirga sp.]|uniref:glycosyltransferase family 4 protein n=1 Tax=uncultured Enterovirga sp. TaxID=2026352 RepID=UPI0035CABDB5
MKIALVTERFDASFGGLERWTIDFASFLAKRDHEVHVVAFGGAEKPGIRLHRANAATTEWGKARALDRAIATLGAVVVHDTGLSCSGDVFQPQTGSRLASLDREIAAHSRVRRLKASISPQTQGRRLMMSVLERRQIAHARAIIAVSGRVRDLITARYEVNPALISIVRNGIDPGRFSRARLAPLRDASRRRLGIADGETLFISVAHNLRLKGVDISLRALAALRADNRSARLVVAGGVPEPSLAALAANLGIGERVTFTGFDPEIERLYAAADVFVHPTRWDACSVSTIEALACGLPVITSEADGASELVRSGETGFVLTDPEDDKALSRTMDTLTDPLHRERILAALVQAAPPLAQDFSAIEAVLAEVSADKR